jgi:hypothetical protein
LRLPKRNLVEAEGSTAQDLSQQGAQSAPIFLLEPPELAEHEAVLDGGEHGLEHGRPEQACLLPLRDGRLADAGGGPRLAGDGQDDQVRPLAVVDAATRKPYAACASIAT